MHIRGNNLFNWRKSESFSEEENFYSKRIRALLVEEDALRGEEDGFMQGYEEEWQYNEEMSAFGEESF